MSCLHLAPGLNLRAIDKDGEPWFVAKDVCGALGMSTTNGLNQWLRYLDASDRLTLRRGEGAFPLLFVGTANSMYLINESGLYALILRSRKPEAKAFQRWVTSEVLPSLRKHGVATTRPVAGALVSGEMGPEELMARALLAQGMQYEKANCVPGSALHSMRPGVDESHNIADQFL